MVVVRRFVQLSLFVLFCAALSSAQTGGGQTGGGGRTGGTGGAPAGNAPTGTSQPRSIPQPSQRPPAIDQPRIIYLTGKVLYDDGTPAPGQVAIERVCNGRARREAYTDSSGHFSITLGRDMGMVQDASVGSNDLGFGTDRSLSSTPGVPQQGVTERDLMGCELRAVASGAWSDVVLLAGRHAMDNPDVGTIVLHRAGKVEGTRISVTAMQAPKDAKKAFERGQKLAQKEKWAEAQQLFQKAVDGYPQYADAWASLGIVCVKLKQPEQARKAFEQSLSADPKFILPYFQLAQMAVGEQDWPRVAQLTDKALELNAYEFPAAYYYNSVAYYELKKFDRAEKSARTARRLDSQYRIPKIDLILSSLLLQRQDYNAAAQQLREFLKHSPTGPDAERARVALADTEQHIASKAGATSVANEQPKQ